ncbi:hypothetical protein DFS33DRAFT_1438674 [Desarmillaria ectypa]|nr:hypothetical protein DFS33DRAFT_1438674 [Desarmillaria ectypa]
MANCNRRVACSIHGCTVTVSRRDDLIRHTLTHTKGKKMFCCTFLQKSNLARHLLAHHSGNKKFQCPDPGCDWASKTKGVLTRHFNRYHVDTTTSSAIKTTMEVISHSTTFSTRKSRTESQVPASSLQHSNTAKPPATLPHPESTAFPNHFIASALSQMTYDEVIWEEECAVHPSSPWSSYPMVPPATVSSTAISILPSVAPTCYFDVPSSSSNIPHHPNTYSDGIQAQSPPTPMPVATRNNELLIWAPSLALADFQQGNPNYTPVAEHQPLTTHPVQFPGDNFGAVPPQKEGGEIMLGPHNSFGTAPHSSWVYILDSSPYSVTYTNAFNASHDASQPIGYQYAFQYVDPVQQALCFAPVDAGHNDSYQAQPTAQAHYQYEGIICHRRRRRTGRS